MIGGSSPRSRVLEVEMRKTSCGYWERGGVSPARFGLFRVCFFLCTGTLIPGGKYRRSISLHAEGMDFDRRLESILPESFTDVFDFLSA